MAIAWFDRLFKRTYRLEADCRGCVAHRAHIEDLQNLLRSERESYAGLQQILLARHIPPPPTTQDLTPVGGVRSTAQRRQIAIDQEKAKHPDARQDYWRKVQDEYAAAGKLPEKDDGGKKSTDE